MKLKNIPNILSTIRICLVFVFVALFFNDHIYAALLVFLLAGATDVIDGYLARRNGWISNLGKVLDPVADKLMQCTVLVSLYIKNIIPLWFVIPFFVKEITTLVTGFLVLRKRSVVVVSKWYGKFMVCLFYGTIVFAVLLKDFLLQRPLIGALFFMPAIAFAIFSFASYVKQYSYLKNEEIQKGNILKNRKED